MKCLTCKAETENIVCAKCAGKRFSILAWGCVGKFNAMLDTTHVVRTRKGKIYEGAFAAGDRVRLERMEQRANDGPEGPITLHLVRRYVDANTVVTLIPITEIKHREHKAKARKLAREVARALLFEEVYDPTYLSGNLSDGDNELHNAILDELAALAGSI